MCSVGTPIDLVILFARYFKNPEKMTSKALNTPLIRRIVAVRGYAQTAPAVQRDGKIQSSVLPNKLVVATLDNNAPVARVTVAFKAGSRYEPQTELGISHVVRSAAGLTTKNASSYILSRKLAQIGASVTASGDREFVYYTLEATQDNLEVALECFNNLVSNQEFRPWELSDNLPRLKYDIAALPPQIRAVDLLHKAAFRRNLGNSLFISPKRIGKVSSESLQHYVSNFLTPSRGAVTGVGLTQEKATLLAQQLQLPSAGQSKEEPSTYYGGEMRKEMGGDLAHVAIAVKGAAANTPQSLALAIAAKALGNGPAVKWGSDHSPLAKAVGNIGPFAAAGFNVSYSDNGLFGVVLSVPKDEANCAAKAVANVLKTCAITSDDITAGKNQLKVQILTEAEEGTSLAESLAVQALYSGSVRTANDLVKQIDQISNNDVAQVVRSAAQCELSMGAAGNLAFVPYVDEL